MKENVYFFRRDKYRVVGFEVEPMSVSVSDIKFEGDTCNFPDTPKPQIVSVEHFQTFDSRYRIVLKKIYNHILGGLQCK